MIYKCKVCGATLNVQQGERIAVCEYCGVSQTVPSFIDIKTQEIYERANGYLVNNEFDKAENLYNQILFDDKTNADAYWNILMCRYGVSYVKDPKNGKYVPTCNRTLYAPIFNDENYINALKYADNRQKELFVANAEAIDEIQKGILEVSKHEKPFDIFISYKETDVDGRRTEDSVAAQNLYDKLTAEGYKVFFSRITLEDKIGTEYEPYIYAALASSKVMITVSSSKENIEAVWVKNEWSRYLSFASKGGEKTLIPLYFDMDRSELPEEFAHLAAYNMKSSGFEQELIRGIKKLIPLPVMLLERRKKRNKILKRLGLGVAVLAVIGAICMIPWLKKLPEYNAAMDLYYEKNYPEAAWAFGAMGDYRNAEEMKEKCELSWRKSLAKVATLNDMGSSSHGQYYLSSNGTVECFDTGQGDAVEGIEINEHGKIVSIGDNYYLYALHEDGYVDNAVINNQLKDDSEWQNIIQISQVFNATSVALNADGKMICGKLSNTYEGNPDDNWLSPVTSWDNIIAFDSYTERYGAGFLVTGAIVAIKSDGTLCGVAIDNSDSNSHFYSLDAELAMFSDVKSVSVGYYDNLGAFASPQLEVTAITNHGTVMSLVGGDFSEFEADDTDKYQYCKYYYQEALILKNNASLYDSYGDKVLLKDVVYFDGDFAITRSGSVYSYDGDGKFKNMNAKACVYDEWVERMN